MVRSHSPLQEATKSLNTVAMILSNFLKDPSSDRNRKVNTSGARFSEIFRNNSAAGELLKLAGFQYQHPNFVYNEAQPNADGAQRTFELVQDAQKNLDQTWAARGDRSAAPPAVHLPIAHPAQAAPVAPESRLEAAHPAEGPPDPEDPEESQPQSGG
eukprot:Skav214859  [mRNA]  locus=scaffold16:500643:502211:+ [translate_table: standard]